MKHDAIGCLSVFAFFALILILMQMCDKISSKDKEDELYNTAIKENTHSAYYDYMKKYPQGKYYEEVRKIDDEICWKKADSVSNLQMYEWYVFVHPQGNFTQQAEILIDKLTIQEEEAWNTDEKAWFKAIQDNNYNKYLSYHPYGKHAIEAEKIVVDEEVKRIMSGQYSSLPDMQSSANDFENQVVSSISVSNNTSFNLTVYYSGSESKRVKLASGQSTTITLRNGNYKIAASVDAPNVRNYAGIQHLSGDNYKVNYHIQTRKY